MLTSGWQYFWHGLHAYFWDMPQSLLLGHGLHPCFWDMASILTFGPVLRAYFGIKPPMLTFGHGLRHLLLGFVELSDIRGVMFVVVNLKTRN